MSINKLVATSTTHRSDRSCGAIHQEVHLLIFLYKYILSHWDNMFLHGRVPLYQIPIWILSQHRSQAWPLLFHILYFIIPFSCQSSARNAAFANGFCLWYLSCFNLRDGFSNTTQRVIFTIIFGGRIQHLRKWLVIGARTMDCKNLSMWQKYLIYVRPKYDFFIYFYEYCLYDFIKDFL